MPGILEGVKVVSFSQVVAMPATTTILADWGADVIKVEPLWGDWQRSLVSFNDTPLLLDLEKGEIQLHFEFLNRNKRSIAVNLRTEQGKHIMSRLLKDIDVFVTNYSVDVLERFGLDYISLKDKYPELIHCLLTGYGTKGPKSRDRGYDYVAAWSYGGIMDLVTADPSNPPAIQRPGMMDMVASAHMLAGICGALYHKQKTGKGQSIELSLYHTAAWTIGLDVQVALFGNLPKKWDRHRMPNPMYNSYQTKDGRWIMMVHPNQEYWAPFCKAIGKPDWINEPRYATMESREENREEIISLLDKLFATKTWLEWEKTFRENDLIFSVNQTISEILDDEQAIANNFYTDIEHPVTGTARLLNSPIQFSETPPEVRSVAPPVGAHTEEILLECGYSWEEIAEFKEQGVIS